MHLSTLFVFFPFLICHVATQEPGVDANEEANHLMRLLKDSIDLQQLDALHTFMSYEFTWDTCKKVLDFDAYKDMLEKMSVHSRNPPPMSTEWKAIDAHFNGHTLYFKIHNVNQKYAKYYDLHFEAKTYGLSAYILSRGRYGRCGLLDEQAS